MLDRLENEITSADKTGEPNLNYAWKTSERSNAWPATRLVYENMRRLTVISNYLKRPITQVIVDATEAYANAILPLLEGKKRPLSKEVHKQIELGQLIWQDSVMAKTAQPIESNATQSELVATIQQLRAEVRVLREAIDEFRETYQYAMLNHDKRVETMGATDLESTPLTDFPTAIIEFPTTKKEEAMPQTGALRIAEKTTSGRQLDLF